MIGLMLFVQDTRMGRAIRATAKDPTAARRVGIPVNRVSAMAFLIGPAFAAMAGVLRIVSLTGSTWRCRRGSGLPLRSWCNPRPAAPMIAARALPLGVRRRLCWRRGSTGASSSSAPRHPRAEPHAGYWQTEQRVGRAPSAAAVFLYKKFVYTYEK